MEMTSGTVNIVGGGIAGLFAAVELAREGIEVSLFEKASEPGGRARTRNVQGFLFNQGPHALYRNGAFKRELDRLGITYSGGRELTGTRKAIWRGKLYELPVSTGSLVSTGLFGIRDKIAFARLLKSIIRGATGNGSFSDWLDAQAISPTVRASVEALGRLQSYANGSSSVAAAKMLEQIRIGLGGTLYVDGGWASLVSALAEAAIKAGARLNYGAAAVRVTTEGGRAKILLRDGSERVADAAILALGPREASTLAPEIPSLAVEAGEAMPVRANTLDLALKQMPAGAHDFALGVDAPLYVSLHSGSAKLAPEDGALVHIAKYLPVGEGPAQDASAELEGVADLVMPGWRSEEITRQQLRGMTVSNGLPRWDRPRPGVVLSDAAGVFIAGDWVGDEGMIADAAAASAVKAARSAMEWLSAKARPYTAA
jgi:phytoene dehydrogenase-like protein